MYIIIGNWIYLKQDLIQVFGSLSCNYLFPWEHASWPAQTLRKPRQQWHEWLQCATMIHQMPKILTTIHNIVDSLLTPKSGLYKRTLGFVISLHILGTSLFSPAYITAQSFANKTCVHSQRATRTSLENPEWVHLHSISPHNPWIFDLGWVLVLDHSQYKI
jgi:hypothetical protein